MAKVEIEPRFNLAAIAEEAGQPDVDKREYVNGFLFVKDVTQQRLDAAALNKIVATPLPRSAAPLDAEELATLLITDGTMTQAKIDAIKAGR